MLKEKQRWSLTDEQRQRILNDPGNVVHRRKDSVRDPFFTPKIQVDVPIRASDLIDSEDSDESRLDGQ
jgi:hypothetical protein